MKKTYSVITVDKYGNEKRSESMEDFLNNDYIEHLEAGGTDEDYYSPEERDRNNGSLR